MARVNHYQELRTNILTALDNINQGYEHGMQLGANAERSGDPAHAGMVAALLSNMEEIKQTLTEMDNALTTGHTKKEEQNK